MKKLSLLKRWSPHCVLLAAWLTLAQAGAAESPLAVVEQDGRPVAIDALGMPPESLEALRRRDDLTTDDPLLERALSLRVVGKPGAPPLPPIAGSYRVVGDALRFTPRFSLKPGLRYEVDYFPPARSALESPAHYSLTIEVPAKPAGQPAATATLFPSAAELPENQLRFYLQFSRPMSRGDVYRHIQLLQADGTPVDLPFLEIGEELWDTSFQRLTLLIDPGRIKRGLKPREEAGPVLEAGRSYTLVVDPAWRDAEGLPMKAGLKRKFSVGAPVEIAIDPKEWKIEPPQAGSSVALRVRFPRSLDQALALRTIEVVDPQGNRVAGEVALSHHERVWSLKPMEKWTAGKHLLVVDTTLEDLAGNRIGRAFEVDVAGPIERRVLAETIELPFTIRP